MKAAKQTKTRTAIEAREMGVTRDAWVVGVFEFWTDLHGNTTAHLVEQIATFNTPDGDELGIARAKAAAEFFRSARGVSDVQGYRLDPEADDENELAEAGPFAYTVKG